MEHEGPLATLVGWILVARPTHPLQAFALSDVAKPPQLLAFKFVS